MKHEAIFWTYDADGFCRDCALDRWGQARIEREEADPGSTHRTFPQGTHEDDPYPTFTLTGDDGNGYGLYCSGCDTNLMPPVYCASCDGDMPEDGTGRAEMPGTCEMCYRQHCQHEGGLPPVPVAYLLESADDGDVFAFFPEEDKGMAPGLFTVYAHVGQHGGADGGYLRDAEPADPVDYADLHAELTKIYDDSVLVIIDAERARDVL